MYEPFKISEAAATFTIPLKDQKCLEEDTVEFTCTASKPNKPIKWLKNGKEIKPNDRFEVKTVDCEYKLIIKDAHLDDAAEYTAKIGDATTKAKLTVDGMQHVFLSMCLM